MAVLKTIIDIVLFVLLVALVICMLPVILLGVAWAIIATAFSAGSSLVTDPLIKAGRRRRFMNRAPMFILFCLLSTPALAQTVSYDVGKTYSVSEGAWVLGQTVGVEYSIKGMTISAARVFNGREVLEDDFGLWREFNQNRWTFAGGLNYYRYAIGGFDWTWSTGVRFRVR